ncbi:hypothetical protein Nepgr_016796 [Nepenthes gracilis]|uniref:Uncharacterized protein n=1 Tax=Nepenthes gracilis TaxID=150966 RepID=A0AAD3XST7_NEPGR|nr:hypothetical protein Nepgr_016796 [Nepenthes gracilis]
MALACLVLYLNAFRHGCEVGNGGAGNVGITETDSQEQALEPAEVPKVTGSSARASPEPLTQGPIAVKEVDAAKQITNASAIEVL